MFAFQIDHQFINPISKRRRSKIIGVARGHRPERERLAFLAAPVNFSKQMHDTFLLAPVSIKCMPVK
jgi:hypothetical protein